MTHKNRAKEVRKILSMTPDEVGTLEEPHFGRLKEYGGLGFIRRLRR